MVWKTDFIILYSMNVINTNHHIRVYKTQKHSLLINMYKTKIYIHICDPYKVMDMNNCIADYKCLIGMICLADPEMREWSARQDRCFLHHLLLNLK